MGLRSLRSEVKTNASRLEEGGDVQEVEGRFVEQVEKSFGMSKVNAFNYVRAIKKKGKEKKSSNLNQIESFSLKIS